MHEQCQTKHHHQQAAEHFQQTGEWLLQHQQLEKGDHQDDWEQIPCTFVERLDEYLQC